MALETPIFRDSRGQRASLFDLFALIQAGAQLELLRLKPHQRAPMVTALAVLMTALQRYADNPLLTAGDWQAEWDRQIGPEALRLVAPEGEVAFFQPPLDEGKNRSSMTLSDIDLTFTKAAHAAKPIPEGDAEEAIFALVSGAWSISVVKWNSGTRQCPSVVVASDDGTFAGEVRHLLKAYEQQSPSIIGSQARATCAADHLLWLRPVSEAGLAVDEVPYPYLEARPVHLVETVSGRYCGIGQHSVPARLAGKGHADDPHVPMIDGKPYRLWGGRVWSMKTQHAMLFGSPEVSRPKALGIAGYRALRLCGIGIDQGKTLGYWEALYPLSKRAVFSLSASPERAADLSQRALGVADEVDGILRWAVGALTAGSFKSASVKATRGRASAMLRDALTNPLTEAILELLGVPANPAAEQQALQKVAVEVLRDVWAIVSTGCPDRLAVAEGTARLNGRIFKLTGDRPVETLPQLSKQVYAVLGEIVAHLTPGDRAKLRTMLTTDPPMLYWTLLSQVPRQLADDPAAEAVWRATMPALGAVRLSKRGIGRVLAETNYPEMRLRQLITATGQTLVGLSAEVVRWLVAHEQTAVNLEALVTLGLADALGDDRTRSELRQRIALDYVRSVARANKGEAA